MFDHICTDREAIQWCLSVVGAIQGFADAGGCLFSLYLNFGEWVTRRCIVRMWRVRTQSCVRTQPAAILGLRHVEALGDHPIIADCVDPSKLVKSRCSANRNVLNGVSMLLYNVRSRTVVELQFAHL